VVDQSADELETHQLAAVKVLVSEYFGLKEEER
jgi:hypothetical protein